MASNRDKDACVTRSVTDTDTSDIPKIKNLSKFIRLSDRPEHPLCCAVTRPVTIRLNPPDHQVVEIQ
jgi:hypothetical protein